MTVRELFSGGGRRSPYVIPDEPAPSRFQHLVVTPTATFLGVMLGGSLAGLPWMAFNGYAMGSARRHREAAWAAGTLLFQLLLLASLVVLLLYDLVQPSWIPYVGLGIHAVRLGGAYVVLLSQQQSFELYTHFGGKVSPRGWTVAILFMMLRLFIAARFPEGVLALLVRY
jgi:hypothetical protein